MSTDNPNTCKVSPSQQSFRKNEHGFDQRGGSGIIPCWYIIYCYGSTFENVRNILHESLKELKFQKTETLFITTEEDKTSRSTCPWQRKINNIYFCIVTRINHICQNLDFFCLVVQSVRVCLFNFLLIFVLLRFL